MPQKQAIQKEEAVRKLGKLIRGIRVAMLVTSDLRGRPMATQQVEFDGDLWFFTKAASPKVHEVEKKHRVNVCYSDPEHQRYVSVSGEAELVRDRSRLEQLWSPVFKAWFPRGLDDPELALLRVHAEDAEYWDSPSSTMVRIAGLARALAKGESYRPGDHKKLDLSA
jgi:general stress protein 26